VQREKREFKERGEINRKRIIIIIMIGKEKKKGTGTGI
jgi:hypothetical protein